MSKFVDHYRTLQVHHDAGQDVINAVYRCFSKMYHPDVSKSKAAEEQMKLINIAYNAVGNPKKRRDYHREWLKLHKENYEDHSDELFNTESREAEFAENALENFFDDLIKEDWRKSYQKLTAADNQNIPLQDYIEWKRAVSQLYKLGNYKITYFCTYENCEYAGINYPKVLHFSVTLTEMEIATGKVNQEQTQKYIALDQGDWKVCLGYTDLKPSIRKFKYLAQALPKIDKDEIIARALDSIDPLTGILSRRGFIEQAEKELLRSNRYGNPLSLATITIRPTKCDKEAFAQRKDLLFSNVSELLSSHIRETDMIGRCNDTSIAILFTETKVDKAKATVNRLLDIAEGDGTLNCELYWGCCALKGGEVTELLEESLEKAVLKEKTTKGPKAKKLGRYQLSDILDFNKKGQNHF
ncbi:MAG: DnaJ domain-containing protein [Anaerovoracaceae bacterium]